MVIEDVRVSIGSHSKRYKHEQSSERIIMNRVLSKCIPIIVMSLLFITSCASTNKNKADATSESNKSEDKTPFLTSPKVRKVWIPEKIENEKYIEGHWMWVIERSTTWSR